jgi:hypothetical protein
MTAYLDPATGSMLLQGLVAAVAGVLVVGRLWWARIKRALGFARTDATTADEQAS